MLQEDLNDDDIPHCTALHNCILQMWDDYLMKLGHQMRVHLLC